MFFFNYPGESKNYITCVICKDLVQLLDDALLSNSTVADVSSSIVNQYLTKLIWLATNSPVPYAPTHQRP